nr:putative ribonuclease H-like domain-containing protein [Tanacetum cinerariifolium]
MEFEFAQNNTTIKLPILKLGEYEIWVIRIKQYFQVQVYALWEVIENGNSWVSVPQTTQKNGVSVTKMLVLVTAEEKINKKNDVKAKSLLLMDLPNEHQHTFSQYNEAKTITTTSKLLKQDVKKSVGTSIGAQNMAFMTAPSTSSTNDVNTANLAYEDSTVSRNVNTASPQVSTSNFSDNAMTGHKIFINANDTAGYDKSKVECFNWHKMGHFARECRAQRNQDGHFRNQDNTRKQGNNEDTSSKAMLAIDAATYKRGLATVEEQLVTHKKNEVVFSEEVAVLKRDVACKEYEINVLKTKFEKGKPQNDDKGFINSGCSRHMTGNIAYLSYFKEFDGGYVKFGGGANSGRIFGKGTLKTDSLDFENDVEYGTHNENDDKDKSEDDSSPKEVNVVRQHVNTAILEVNTGRFELNTVDPSLNTASSSDPHSPTDMFKLGASDTLEATHFEFFSDRDAPEVDLGNIHNSYGVPTTSHTRIHKDHPIKNMIGEVQSIVQTRRMTKPTSEKGFLSVVYEEKTHAIGTKWDFRNKKDERGIVIRNKPRLVAQGHRQEEGIDYDEVFALVARIKAIRLFLSYASFMGFLVYQINVKSAFLHGTIEEEVYVTQPPGFKDPDHPDKIYKDKYVHEILKKINYSDVKSASTLVDLEKPLVTDRDANNVDVHLYRSMIGSLMYLTASRPDIMFAVGDEAVHKEWGDRMERAAATASSLEVVVSGAKIQFGDVEAQTRFKAASKQFNDPPLLGVNTLGCGEDSIKLKELMYFCTKLSE